MSATTPEGAKRADRHAGELRFGHESESGLRAGDGGRALHWLLKRNCSMSPRQLFGVYAWICVLSLGIASGFWWLGATWVAPFAGLELLGLGAAVLVYARHATDRESIRLDAGGLTVEHAVGRRIERVEFRPEWVRVETVRDERALIELSGQGRRVAVGRYLRPELRRGLADELRWALQRWHAQATRVAV